MGQVYDEFILNKSLINQLKAIRLLQPKDRIKPLRRLLLRNPDHTPTAIQLLITLRRANLFDRPKASEIDNPIGYIPRSIMQFWDTSEPPSDISALMQTWRSENQGYQYRLFDDTAAKEFLASHYEPAVLQAYQRAENPAEKADLFRLAYLYAEGGTYVDADDRCLAPIESIISPDVHLVLYQEDDAFGSLCRETLGNNFIAVAPQHPVLGCALELATQSLNRGDHDVVWLKTGPALISRAFCQIAANTLLDPAAWLKNIAILKRSELYQVSAVHCFAAYKNISHWSKSVAKSTAEVRTSTSKTNRTEERASSSLVQ